MSEEEKRLEGISAAVVRYYDSLTYEQVAEDRAWGEFAAAQLSGEEGSDEWQSRPAAPTGEAASEIQRRVLARQLLKE